MSYEKDPADGITTVECPKCHGKDKKCDRCGGLGIVRKTTVAMSDAGER